MQKLYLLLLFNICPYFYFGQMIKINYKFNISDISSTNEQLFVQKNNIYNVRDSIISFQSIGENATVISRKDIPHKIYYFRNSKNDKIIIDTYFNNDHYIVEDKIPKMNWVINPEKTKKILNYNCIEATSTFRGNNITAYFTKEIPISEGPYKFGGLPGLILELHGEDNNFNSWIATEINLNFKKNIMFKLNSKIKPVSYENFIKLEDEKNNEFFTKLTKNLPSNARAIQTKIPRQTIEKTFEWEVK